MPTAQIYIGKYHTSIPMLLMPQTRHRDLETPQLGEGAEGTWYVHGLYLPPQLTI